MADDLPLAVLSLWCLGCVIAALCVWWPDLAKALQEDDE